MTSEGELVDDRPALENADMRSDPIELIESQIITRYPDNTSPKQAEPVRESEPIETEEERIERLGRQKPDIFPSLWSEVGFCFSVCMSQILSEYFVSGFTVLLPTLQVELNIPAASAIWPASSFSLVLSSFLLPFGRLADMYGGCPIYVFGLGWLTVWSLIAGFSQNEICLISVELCKVSGLLHSYLVE